MWGAQEGLFFFFSFPSWRRSRRPRFFSWQLQILWVHRPTMERKNRLRSSPGSLGCCGGLVGNTSSSQTYSSSSRAKQQDSKIMWRLLVPQCHPLPEPSCWAADGCGLILTRTCISFVSIIHKKHELLSIRLLFECSGASPCRIGAWLGCFLQLS